MASAQTAPITARWLGSETETAVAIDADATVPLVGTGTVAWSPRGVTIVGDLRRVSKLAGGVAAVTGTIGGFCVAMMWQSEQWPPTLIAIALVSFGLAALGFARRHPPARPTRYDVPWTDIKRITEESIDGAWAIALRQPRGSVRFRIDDEDEAVACYEAAIAAGELGLAAVTFCQRAIPHAEQVSPAGPR